jgi:hypothetical protein
MRVSVLSGGDAAQDNHGGGGIGRDTPLLCFSTGVIHENLV